MNKKIFKILKKLDINYKLYEHEELFTCEQSQNIFHDLSIWHTKNLFLTNDKKSKYYLIVLSALKKADLKSLAQILWEKKFSFARENDLQKYLSIKPWSVSIFWLINDVEKQVNLIIDEYLRNGEKIFAHPNINTQTLELKTSDIKKFLKIFDINYKIIKI